MLRGDLRTKCALEKLKETKYKDLVLDGNHIKGLIEQIKRETEKKKKLQKFIHQSIEIAKIVAGALKKVV